MIDLRKLKPWLHGAVGVLLCVLVFWMLSVVDGTFHTDVLSGIRHMIQMAVFSVAGLAIALLVLYVIGFSPARDVCIPQFDVLLDVEAKWRRGEPLTPDDRALAQAAAISSGGRVLGVLVLIALLSTPL